MKLLESKFWVTPNLLVCDIESKLNQNIFKKDSMNGGTLGTFLVRGRRILVGGSGAYSQWDSKLLLFWKDNIQINHKVGAIDKAQINMKEKYFSG